ncbi:hypothetical protein FB45DRAFT_1008147 [Roridomyces roridus]|uniref:Uncharacterized protein n=1 Tax=Roridomyces roridus TaxID=1738132 RepID=A0AAD7FEN9_9AGAR|nr:hypothetical protein FB45DRAFT_1008147 [Roridomyces roridus]
MAMEAQLQKRIPEAGPKPAGVSSSGSGWKAAVLWRQSTLEEEPLWKYMVVVKTKKRRYLSVRIRSDKIRNIQHDRTRCHESNGGKDGACQPGWYSVGERYPVAEVPDPRLTGIPDKDDRTEDDRNSGTKDSKEGQKVGGGRWSPTGDTTKTQGDQVPYTTSRGNNPDETREDKRRARKRARGRARSSQGQIDQER